jgi:hypothetical protein
MGTKQNSRRALVVEGVLKNAVDNRYVRRVSTQASGWPSHNRRIRLLYSGTKAEDSVEEVVRRSAEPEAKQDGRNGNPQPSLTRELFLRRKQEATHGAGF